VSDLVHGRKVKSQPSKRSVILVAPKKRQQSVTKADDITHLTRVSPAKRYAALQPWVDFAHAARPLVRDVSFKRPQRERQTGEALAALGEFVDRASETDNFPAELLRGLLKPSPESGLGADAGAKIIADLADQVIGILDYCVDRPSSPVPPPFYRVAAQGQTLISVETGCVARKAIGDPLEPFLRALEGSEANRIRRCPFCDRFFFAVRKDRPACSRVCGTALRVRKHRQRDDERISRAAAMDRAGKAIKEIAQALEVTPIQARRDVYKAREQKRKGG
jgi:hypothetical protein